MIAPATVHFSDVILALHVISVIVAFGVLFAYPLFMLVGARLDPAAMPWFHQMQQSVSRRLTSPGLVLVVVFGVILASELHAWKAFYVQWGIGVSIVIGAIEGLFMAPHVRRLVELSRRDLQPSPTGPSVRSGGAPAATLSAEYQVTQRQTLLGAVVISVLVLITVFLMALHIGG